MINAVFATAWLLPAVLFFLDGRRRAAGVVAIAGLALLTTLLATTWWRVAASGPFDVIAGGWPAGIGIRLRADALGTTFALLTAVVVLASVVHQYARGINTRSFPALAAALQLGLTGVFFTADAFNFYVFFEIAMTSSFALAAYCCEPQRYRAAYTFAVVNLLGSVIFLTAVAGLYRVTGTLDMLLIQARIGTVPQIAVLVIAASVFIAFGVKLGLFPFHFWLPPVYRDTVPAVAAMLSGALANIGSYGLLRFGAGLLRPAIEDAGWVLLVLGSASVIYGSVVAVGRSIYPEVLAYSSIAQAGYILLAIGLGTPIGFAAAVVYAVINSLNKTLLFLCGGVRTALLAPVAAVGALSVAGVPPSSGFFGKAALLRAAAADDAAIVLTVIVAGSLLSIAYMFRAHVTRFWMSARPEGAWTPVPLWAVLAALAIVVAAGGLWPEPLLRAGARAAAALEAP